MFNILFSPKRAERHPFEMMLIGIFYSTVSILLSAWIFPDHSSLIMIFFTVISCLYVIQGAMRLEENKDRNYKSERWILKEHSKLIVFLLFLFLGYVFSFTFWTIVLPNEKITLLFSIQGAVVDGIRSNSITGNVASKETFFIILNNNLKVLFLSLILAFFYGAGSIFVLVWNASVMGFVIGNLAKTKIGIVGLPVAFTKYFLHGIPEMLAYLVVALAGSIIYIAIWKGDFFKVGRIRKIFFDSFILVFISLVLLIFAAIIEVFVSPYI